MQVHNTVTYTCVGDTVNLAARMEDHTKVAGHPILFYTPTRAGLPDFIQVKSLGSVAFKGKTMPSGPGSNRKVKR